MACWILARTRPADGRRRCLFIGADRKSSAHPRTAAFDPKRTWRVPLLDHLAGVGMFMFAFKMTRMM
jgi:hypothetical protein